MNLQVIKKNAMIIKKLKIMDTDLPTRWIVSSTLWINHYPVDNTMQVENITQCPRT